VALVVYALTLSKDVGLDDGLFAMSVDAFLQGKGMWWGFVHPHHPLYNPLIALCTWGGRMARPWLPVLDVGAAVSAVFGSLAVGGTVHLLRRRGIPSAYGLLTAGALIVTGGFWMFSIRTEVYTMTAVAVVVWLAAVSDRRERPLLIGATLAAAIVSHVAAGLLVVPTIWRLRHHRRDLAVSVGLALGVSGTLIYVLIAATHGAWSPGAWLDVVAPRTQYDDFVRPSVSALGSALHKFVVADGYHRVPFFTETGTAVLDALGAAATGLAAFLFAYGAWVTLRRRFLIGTVALVGCAAYLPLWFLWDAGNVEHVVVAGPLFAVVVAAGALGARRRTIAFGLVALVAVLALVNGVGTAVPQSRVENSPERVLAWFLSENTSESAVILTAGTDVRFRWAVAYMAGRRFKDLALMRANLGASSDRSIVLDGWTRTAGDVQEVWALPDVFAPEGRELATRLGFQPEDWNHAVSRLEPVRTQTLPADGVVIRKDLVLTRVRLR
jgi:hypothetical protein